MTDSTTPNGESDPMFDRIEADDEANDIVTNDAVGGETVWEGSGDGNDGPTGGAPDEGRPDFDHYAPGEEYDDEAQPFGDKTPDDLRGDDGDPGPTAAAGDGPDKKDWTEDTV